MPHLLLIEDDATLRHLLADALEMEGHKVTSAADGPGGLAKALRLKLDLVVLDVMLPGMTGYEVCRTLRKEGFDRPILMLTARSQETDKVVGLDLGADDYLVKPIGVLELHARVRALLRRGQGEKAPLAIARFGGVEVDFKKMTATRGNVPIPLTTREFQILELMVRHEGEVLSRDVLLEKIWGYKVEITTRAVDNQIVTLRQKLADPAKRKKSHIQTVHGAGYKFVQDLG